MKKLLFICMLLLMSALYVQQATAQKQPHKEYAESKLSECASCHKAEGVAPTHDATGCAVTGPWQARPAIIAPNATTSLTVWIAIRVAG